jgi:hypothetical protein
MTAERIAELEQKNAELIATLKEAPKASCQILMKVVDQGFELDAISNELLSALMKAGDDALWAAYRQGMSDQRTGNPAVIREFEALRIPLTVPRKE